MLTDETDKMQTSRSILCVLAALNYGCVLVKLTFLDSHVDANNVLPDNPTSADIQMPAKWSVQKIWMKV